VAREEIISENDYLRKDKKMLVSTDHLEKYDVVAIDGEIGSLRGFFFDETSWRIHYFILDTGSWLPGRKVIISPQAFKRFDHDEKKAYVSLTKEKIESSPEVNEDEPLSQDLSARTDRYYNWSGGLGTSTRLQSTRDLIDSYIDAQDGDLGHVEDFIVDLESWEIRYMVVDTANWWPGKKVLISPRWIQSLKWADKKVHVDLTKEQIKNSPEYTPGEIPARDYEERLYGHYGRSGYWQQEDYSDRPPLR
jgi:hypothetical protein